jgi:NAD(P)H dehydrogenase (quinone)
MNASIILAHPNPKSFNHAIAAAAREVLQAAGWTINWHDLYAEHFDPLLPAEELARDVTLPPEIKQHCDEIVSADAIVIVHPNWWGQPPAILRGWQDRVLRMGIAYRFGTNAKGEGVPIGLLNAKWAIVFTTSNTPRDKEIALFGDPLQNLWTRCVLQFCGVQNTVRRNFEVIITSKPDERAIWLDKARQMVATAAAGVGQGSLA